MAEYGCLLCISWGFNWRNRAFQAFLTPNWHFWQMAQISDKCLFNIIYICKTEKTQISGQTQIIWVRWGLWCQDFGSACSWNSSLPDLSFEEAVFSEDCWLPFLALLCREDKQTDGVCFARLGLTWEDNNTLMEANSLFPCCLLHCWCARGCAATSALRHSLW